MLQHINRAQRSVALEFYICKPGVVSERFRTALIAACLRGVNVQLLLDAFGSDEVAGGFWRELEQRGGQLRWFNPLRLLRLSFRNHRKLLIIDGVTVIVGGLNLADEYDGDGVSHGWRDLALELRGPMVEALTASFVRMWALAAFGPATLRLRPRTPALGSRRVQAGAVAGGAGVPHRRLTSAIVCRPAHGFSSDRPCCLLSAFAGAWSHSGRCGVAW